MPAPETSAAPYPRHALSTRYSIELPVEDARVLFTVEDRGFDPKLVSLLDRMTKLTGVFDIEYNGHFGPGIFYTVDDDEDTPSLHKKIDGIIKKQVVRCRKIEARHKARQKESV